MTIRSFIYHFLKRCIPARDEVVAALDLSKSLVPSTLFLNTKGLKVAPHCAASKRSVHAFLLLVDNIEAFPNAAWSLGEDRPLNGRNDVTHVSNLGFMSGTLP
jgi:hypothetical protein